MGKIVRLKGSWEKMNRIVTLEGNGE